MTKGKTFITAAAIVLAFQAPAFAESISLSVVHAEVGSDPVAGRLSLVLRFEQGSVAGWESFTAAHVGHPIELRAGKQLLATPVIREPIKGDMLHLWSDMPRDALALLVDKLRSGEVVIEITPLRSE